MGAGAKLDRLKLEWIAYGVLAAVLGWLRDTPGSEGLRDVVIQVAVSAAIAWFFTRQLQRKSSVTWAFGVVIGLLGGIVSALAVIGCIAEAAEGELDVLALAHALASTYIYFRTFRLLRDTEVKRHVMLD